MRSRDRKEVVTKDDGQFCVLIGWHGLASYPWVILVSESSHRRIFSAPPPSHLMSSFSTQSLNF